MPSVDRDIEADTLGRSIKARWDLLKMTGEKLVDEHRMRVAETLLSCGLTLIPSEHLLDHQFVVSRGVYEAAKKFGAMP
jgi:hypothetical protein